MFGKNTRIVALYFAQPPVSRVLSPNVVNFPIHDTASVRASLNRSFLAIYLIPLQRP